ncbi:YbfB/YjiJ family MFS transporter [uncultured Ferrovibrio sp.]|jgi:predicted MFS family arabinose efflux permease|uniref:YbfB/YjiJ family MFS transporter n=1 Tax=uncultured Ferrovibrio sp. TaxID=1576913 RepID=UPI0026218027|nr:YbfB/YjiJ family MFS transporter [uncultured Ferrovibrio sp.]
MINPVWRDALAGLCALLVGIGFARFGYTPLIPVLIEQQWLTAGDAAYLGATNLAGYVVGSLLTASLARIAPMARLTQFAMTTTGISLIACALPWGFAWFAPWRFLAGFTGGLLMVGAVPLVLARAPATHRARSNGIVFTGVGIGIICGGTLVPSLAAWGPMPVWLGMGVLTLLLAALTWRQWAGGDIAPITAPTDLPPRRFTLPVALLLAAYILDAAGFVPHTVFWADYIARGLGRGVTAGGLFWVLFGIGALCGPLLSGIVAERLGFYRSFVGGLGIKAAAVLLPILSQHPVSLMISAMVVGALTPGISALASGRVAEMVGFTGHRQVWGWLTVGWALSSAGFGYLLSFLFDLTGSYNLLFAFGAAGLSGALILAAFAKARQN